MTSRCGCAATTTAREIDVRSASRYGRHDFGTNAARIRSLLEDIDDRLTADSDKAERAAQRQSQQRKQQGSGKRQAEARERGRTRTPVIATLADAGSAE